MSIPFSLEGKVALISGGSRGIGAATVRMFTAAGAKVGFSYRSAAGKPKHWRKNAARQMCHPVACDLNSRSGAVAGSGNVKHFGRLDIVVANHGVWPVEDVPIERMSDEQWRSTLTINLDGVFRIGEARGCTDEIAATNGRVPRGTLCSSAPLAGSEGKLFTAITRRAKALISMVKGLSRSCVGRHLCEFRGPGWVDTDMSAEALQDPRSGEEIRRTIPMGRVGRRKRLPDRCYSCAANMPVSSPEKYSTSMAARSGGVKVSGK